MTRRATTTLFRSVRALAMLLLLGCAGARPAAPTEPGGPARAFELDAFLASTEGPPSARECARARAAATTHLARARVERRCDDPRAAELHYRAALHAAPECDVALELADLLPTEAQRELLAPFAAVSEASLDALEIEVCRAAVLRLAPLLRGVEGDGLVSMLAALLGRDPGDADALAELALHHLARSQLGAAASVCERVPSSHARGMLACARVAFRDGSLHVAERRLRASIAGEPTTLSLRALGRLLVSTRRYREAVPLFHRVHEHDPTDYDALIDLGASLVWSHCIDAGRAAYRLAAERDPERPEAWYDIGLLYQFVPSREQLRASMEAFSRFMEIAEGRPELAPLVRSVRDEECIAARRAPRPRRWGARPSCDPGHEMHIIWDADGGLIEVMQRMMVRHGSVASDAPGSAPAAPAENPPFSCADYPPRRVGGPAE